MNGYKEGINAMIAPAFISSALHRVPFITGILGPLIFLVLSGEAQHECQGIAFPCTHILAPLPRGPEQISFPRLSPRALKLHLLLRSIDRITDTLNPSLLNTVGAFLPQTKLASIPPLALKVRPEPRVLELDSVLADLGDEAQDQNGA